MKQLLVSLQPLAAQLGPLDYKLLILLILIYHWATLQARLLGDRICRLFRCSTVVTVALIFKLALAPRFSAP
ncbi:hypothetical protein CHH28_07530 [Bacterioplanes sanyensis]|uniref:Uncharacterized protein n=1 Tax=Bacterioplanes sanyensis TaxID=1249553 RepID=A0A222FJX3_9GAMM|nr:hypothetical protein CHH28_07530 [Bacterioplanes sanyensis]